jgi:CPA1 family monovalent cation:H+ antiporter
MNIPAIPLDSIGLFLLVAAAIAMLTRRLGLPYSVGLVAAGVLISFVPHRPELPLSRDLIFNILLPPLIFDAALQLKWKPFRRELPLTLTLAFAGVTVASAFVAGGMHWLLGWSWIGACLFAVLIAATDPVAVIAAFKEMNAEKRLSMIVESESLINDGVAAVGFAVLVSIAAGETAGAVSIIPQFLWTLFGGVGIGGAIALLIILVAGRTEDHFVEITLTTIAAFGSFLIAEDLHASGILASLTAGLLIGNLGPLGAVSDKGRVHVVYFWEYAAFLANSFVFLLIGLSEASIPVSVLGWVGATTAILLVLIGRAIAVYPIAATFSRSALSIPSSYQHILFWGGLRGALALALALTIPASVPERVAIIVTAFVVVAFSIFVQGLGMPWLVKKLGVSANKEAKA